MNNSSPRPIAISGKARDIGFLAGLLRAQKIPFRQALTFGRKPVLQIPAAYAAALQTLLNHHATEHPIEFVSTEELTRARDVFWFMVLVAAGILSIAWGRYFIRKFF